MYVCNTKMYGLKLFQTGKIDDPPNLFDTKIQQSWWVILIPYIMAKSSKEIRVVHCMLKWTLLGLISWGPYHRRFYFYNILANMPVRCYGRTTNNLVVSISVQSAIYHFLLSGSCSVEVKNNRSKCEQNQIWFMPLYRMNSTRNYFQRNY